MKKTLFSMALLPLFAGAAMSEDLNYTVNNDTDTKGSIFVGGKLSADESVAYQTVNVNISGGTISAGDGENLYWKDGIYAGASEFGNENTSFTADKVSINMTGGDINNIIAGSFSTEKGSTSIGSTEITISGGLVRNSVLGGSILTYNNATNMGYATSHVGSSKITISGDAVIGESVSSAKDKSENNDVIFNSVYGGGYTAGSGTQTFGSTSVSIGGNAIVNGIVIGGSHAGPTGTAYVGNKDASDFSAVVSTVSISENAEVRGGYVFGGAYHSWGDGAKSSDIYGSTQVSVTGGKIYNETEGTGYVFGGGYSSDGNNASQASISNVWGNTNVNISGGEVGNVYGGMYVNEVYGYGSAMGDVKGNTNISITGGNVGNVFGGGLTERLSGDESLTIKTSVLGNTDITISDTSVSGSVYGGGNGQNSIVEGDSTITLTGNASVAGTINGGGLNGATVNGVKTLNIGSSTSAYTGGQTLKIADFDKIKISNNSSAKISANISGVSASSSQIIGGIVSGKAEFENSSFRENAFEASEGSIYGGVFASGQTVNNSVFESNSANVVSETGNYMVYGTVASIRNTDSANFVECKFDSNTAYSTYRVQGGVLQVFNGGNLNVENSSFINNSSTAVNKARGGAIENYNANLSVSNTVFEGNSVASTSLSSYGGAIYSSESSAVSNLNDVVFSGNSAISGYGGAVAAEGKSLINFNATDDAVFSGNYATNAEGLKDDSRGGFLYLSESAQANFDISGNKSLTIGNGTEGYDSISSDNSAVSISKNGSGNLIVNGSMQYYTGSITVNSGYMSINKALGASQISISEGAKLSLALSESMPEGTKVSNQGTLSLSRGTLADNASITFAEYSGIDAEAFGGTFKDGVFTAGKSAELSSAPITVGTGDSDVQSVVYNKDAQSLTLDFNIANMGAQEIVIKSISESQDTQGISGTVLAAFDIAATYDESGDWTVVLSAGVDLTGIDTNSLKAWHKSDGGTWQAADDILVEYSDGFAKFVVDGFSSWAISGAAIPEPSAFAILFGAISILFAGYRKQR